MTRDEMIGRIARAIEHDAKFETSYFDSEARAAIQALADAGWLSDEAKEVWEMKTYQQLVDEAPTIKEILEMKKKP